MDTVHGALIVFPEFSSVEEEDSDSDDDDSSEDDNAHY
jgi:hypothetical protein